MSDLLTDYRLLHVFAMQSAPWCINSLDLSSAKEVETIELIHTDPKYSFRLLVSNSHYSTQKNGRRGMKNRSLLLVKQASSLASLEI